MDPILTAGQLGAISLIVVDYPDDIQMRSPAADATGTAYLLLDPVPTGFLWRVERITTFVSDATGALLSNTPADAMFGIYKVNGGQLSTAPSGFRDGSQSPGLDVADQSAPITVQSGLSLLCYWTDLTPGTYGNITVQYQLIAKLSGVTS